MPDHRLFATALLPLLLLLPGCGSSEPFDPYPGYRSEVYGQDSMWLCRPGIENDRCYDDLTATEIHPDGSRSLVFHQPDPDPAFDCFYVYPTVDMASEPGNHSDFSDVRTMLDPLYTQAARFTGLCRVYAPLYRQATMGCFLTDERDQYIAFAYQDVLDAFKHYMAQYNQGRDLVLIGHSQGSWHITTLLQQEFGTNPALRERLIMALAIGGAVLLPEDRTAGGTFAKIPVCTRVGERGCVLAYNSFAADFPPELAGWMGSSSEGLTSACTNPANLEGATTRFRESYFPRASQFGTLPFPSDLTTPFVLYRDFYTGACLRTGKGFSYLAIGFQTDPSDQRVNYIPFEILSHLASYAGLSDLETGLHLLDYNFPFGDLLELVRSAAR